MRTSRWRPWVAAFVLALAGSGYVAAPFASGAAATPDLTLSEAPSTAATLSGAVVAGPGGSSTGYYTPVAVITPGGSLTFVNLDQLAHTVTSVARKPDGSPLFNGNALPGTTVKVVGTKNLPPGNYKFYCQFHPNMTGTLIVEGKSTKPLKPVWPKFPQPLRIPKVLTGSHITIPVKQANVRVLPTGPRTRMWTFGGSYPGPTIERPAGHRTTVTFVNKLPHYVGSITVHLHGDHHSSANDGQPDSHLIKPGGRRTYVYPLTDHGKPETEAFDFYHDHRMDVTGRDNWNGLQGMFIVDRPGERKLHLPRGKYDIPLDVADRSFDNLNQLTEPFTKQSGPNLLGAGSPPGDATVGDHILVNGTYAPHLAVKAHRYRLRLLNSSNFSSYDFKLSGGLTFTQIGTGDSLLPKPVVRNDILLGPAQRADVVVNFRHSAHHHIVLRSVPRTNTPPGGIGTVQAPLMEFRVHGKTHDHTHVPSHLPTVAPISAPSVPSAVWVFGLGGSLNRGLVWSVNGQPYAPTRVDLKVPLGSTQTWLLVNLSPITHYIHIHEEQWHTLLVNGQQPPPWESALDDTWTLDPGDSVEVAAKFTDYTGVFMIHCHMLDHEDHGMMAQWAVVKPGSSKLPAGYYGGSGPATPTALAKLPLRRAMTTVARVSAGGSPSTAMSGMDMAAMSSPTESTRAEPAAWPVARRRLLVVVALALQLATLTVLLRRRPWRPAGRFGMIMTAGRRLPTRLLHSATPSRGIS